MKFKVLQGGPTFEKLTEILNTMRECHRASKVLLDELGANQYCDDAGFNIIYGGISGIEFETPPDKNWRKVFTNRYDNVYMPIKNRSANKEILKRIEDLPKVTADDLCKATGFKEQTIGKRWYMNPLLHSKIDLFLIAINEECKFKPKPDMIEITVSEYRKLEKLPNAKIKSENADLPKKPTT